MVDPTMTMLEIENISNVVGVNKKVTTDEVIDKTSAQMSRLVHTEWLSHYFQLRYIFCDNSSEFKLYFNTIYNQCGVGCKPTIVKNQ